MPEQVRDCVRLVSPQEYDMALQQHPASCPLAVMGDLRRGQQLLDDAELDAHQTVLSIASTPQGCTILQQLAERVEGLSASFNTTFQAPAGAATSALNHRECQDAEGDEDLACGLGCVQRPIAYQVRTFRFDRESALLSIMARRNWARGVARRHWTFGYAPHGLVSCFNAVTPPLEAAIEAMLEALQQGDK